MMYSQPLEAFLVTFMKKGTKMLPSAHGQALDDVTLRVLGAEIIRRNADAAGRRRIKRPESENLTIFVGILHLV